jgi:hypothetical protein
MAEQNYRIDHKSNALGLAQSMLGHKWSVELDGDGLECYLDSYMNNEAMSFTINSVGGMLSVEYKITAIEKVSRDFIHFFMSDGKERKITGSASHRITFEVMHVAELSNPQVS